MGAGRTVAALRDTCPSDGSDNSPAAAAAASLEELKLSPKARLTFIVEISSWEFFISQTMQAKIYAVGLYELNKPVGASEGAEEGHMRVMGAQPRPQRPRMGDK